MCRLVQYNAPPVYVLNSCQSSARETNTNHCVACPSENVCLPCKQVMVCTSYILHPRHNAHRDVVRVGHSTTVRRRMSNENLIYTPLALQIAQRPRGSFGTVEIYRVHRRCSRRQWKCHTCQINYPFAQPFKSAPPTQPRKGCAFSCP